MSIEATSMCAECGGRIVFRGAGWLHLDYLGHQARPVD